VLAVVEQQADAPAGLLGDWAHARGLQVRTLRAAALDDWPDPGGFTAVAALGSDRSVERSSDAWIAAEIAFLRSAHAAGVPVLGICFGAQALAAALGARVGRAPAPEIGWIELDGAGADLRGPWLAWHEDGFALPPGALELARSGAGVQAFAVERSVGVQFHPEVTPAIVEAWIEGDRASLAAARIDPDALLAQTRRLASSARERAFALFDRVATRWRVASLAGGEPQRAGT
jgi:GMP synthase-like glutamine amidotransferase